MPLMVIERLYPQEIRRRISQQSSIKVKQIGCRNFSGEWAPQEGIFAELHHLKKEASSSPGAPVSSTRKLISSSFHRLDMTLAVAEG